MSDDVDAPITFGCYYGGKIETIGGKDMYVGGGYRYLEVRPSALFSELMNNLSLSLYAQRVFYKVPFDDIEDRKLLTNGDENFKKICKAALWTKAIDIFVEPDIEGDVAEREENERDRNEREENRNEKEENERDRNEREENDRDRNEREENEIVEYQFDEEARVKRNVTDFVDEEIDEYATPVCSDDDEYDHEGLKYFRYKNSSGELKLQMVFDSLEAFKKAMLEYVLKHVWNVIYSLG